MIRTSACGVLVRITVYKFILVINWSYWILAAFYDTINAERFTIIANNFALWEGKTMYQSAKYSNHQYSFTDFNQSCGMQLDETNEWVRLADRIPWHKMEAKYVAMFPSHTGRLAIPFRMAMGVRIIPKRKKLSDRALVKELTEKSISAVFYRHGILFQRAAVKAYSACQPA